MFQENTAFPLVLLQAKAVSMGVEAIVVSIDGSHEVSISSPSSEGGED